MSAESMNPLVDAERPGFYGKVPTRGDFVSRRLPRLFVDAWDPWLQEALAASREQLGEAWLDYYLTSPMWRFALASGVCGEPAWLGLLMPSVDRVGRYFPLTLAASLDDGSSLMPLLTDTDAWYLACEDHALSTLEDNFDIDVFDRTLQDMHLPDTRQRPTELRQHSFTRPAWQFELTRLHDLSEQMPGIGQTLLNNLYQGHSLWWTQGSERVSPSLLITEGMPPVASYSGLLDGNWHKWGWGQYRLPLGTGDSGPEEEDRPAP